MTLAPKMTDAQVSMARTAGFMRSQLTVYNCERLARFAALVRAQVLEEAAQKAERLAEKDQPGAALCRTVLTAATIRALK